MIRKVSWEVSGFPLLALLCLAACTSQESRIQESHEAATGPASVSHAEAGPEGRRLTVRIDRDTTSATYGSVGVNGLDAGLVQRVGDEAGASRIEWEDIFTVTLDGEGETLSLFGSYSEEEAGVRFTPRFPFVPGLSYRVRFDASHPANQADAGTQSGLVVDTFFVFADPASFPDLPLANVARVYPTADTLPANLLKMYLYFSAPMSVGQAYENLRLIDVQSEEPVDAPFLEMEPELWDPDRRRFTLFFDPGRIKREVGPHVEMGPPLLAGRRYRLEIDASWSDARGRPLGEPFARDFVVAEDDRRAVEPASWAIEKPAASTLEPLVLQFYESLDHALAGRALRVREAGGAFLTGQVELANAERTWRFYPATPWAAGNYELHIAAYLEDLAGNTYQSLFDVDLATAPSSEVREAKEVFMLSFEIDRLTE